MDALYQDRRLVDVYDVINQSRMDFDFYAAELPNPPACVLDIGCGTGTFARELAADGYDVTAVDPAPQMIARAMQKDRQGSVTWVTGFTSDLPPSPKFDAAIMTGHAFQCLLNTSEVSALFCAVQQRLAPGGSFWFETRNPAVRPWLKWTPDHAAPAYALDAGRMVKVVHRVLQVQDDCVTFEETYDFNDNSQPLTSQSTLRFLDLEQITNLAAQSGLTVADTFGSWNRDPFAQDSPEIIVHLTKLT